MNNLFQNFIQNGSQKKKIGFIGYGSIGKMLVTGFLSSGIAQKDLAISNRNSEKLKDFKLKYEQVEIFADNKSLADKCSMIFLCVKPLDVPNVLKEIKSSLDENTHIISVAACVTLDNVESALPSTKITKVIPSITSEVGEGISLICHNKYVTKEDAPRVELLLGAISTVKIINENDFEAAADLTSCAPGLIAAIFQEFVEAGLRHSSLSRQEAESMVVSTLFGTSKLLMETGMSFDETIQRVATKGGITEEGVKILRNGLPLTFNRVFEGTLAKHEIVKTIVRERFS